MPTFGLYYRIVVKDKNGKIVRKTRLRKSHSLVLNFLKLFEAVTAHAYGVNPAYVSITNTDGVAKSFPNLANALAYSQAFLPPVDSTTHGIILGTGTTAAANTNTKLETPIGQGVGAGQLDHGAGSYTSARVVGGNVDFVLSRSFYNGSGNTITVKEMGVYMAQMASDGVAYSICIIRDIIAFVDILDTETASAQYTFRTTA